MYGYVGVGEEEYVWILEALFLLLFTVYPESRSTRLVDASAAAEVYKRQQQRRYKRLQ